MNKKILYYFAHPYTLKDEKGNNIHAGEEANFNLCCIRSAKLLEKGIFIYSPIAHTHPIHIRSPYFLRKKEYKLWLDLDKKIMPVCKGIILAPGWEESHGCILEKRLFEERGFKVLLYKDIIKENT